MNRISFGYLISSVALVSACGGSSGGNNNAQCNTPKKDDNLNSIVIPGSNTPARGNTPVPNTPINPQDKNLPEPTADNCNTTKPGNLGNTPDDGTPVAGNPQNQPNIPSRNGPANNPNIPGNNPPNNGNPTFPGNSPIGGNPTGNTFDVTPLIGRWNFDGVFCEDGSMSPNMQRLNQMRADDMYYLTLTVTRTGIEENTWVKFEDENTGSAMMCTLKQEGTFLPNGAGFVRITLGASTYEDAGGQTTCNLGKQDAAIFEKVSFVTDGNSYMIRTIANTSECRGKPMLQSFTKTR
jgi:hypothetical protein